MIIEIEALDTLFFRDGKPFSKGDDVWATGMFPPLPSVLYGVLRSAYLGQNDVSLDNIKRETEKLRIKNIWYEIKGSNEQGETNFKYLPLPLDLIQKKELSRIEKIRKEEAYSNNAEVKDLKALLDHLELTSTIVIGYSRGSIILSKWLTEESRIEKAVIGGMGLHFTNPNWNKKRIFERAFLGLDSLTDMTRGALNYARSQKADLMILGWSQRYQPVTSINELRSITIPLLVVAGDQDVDNGNPRELAAILSNATLSIVEGDHNTTYRKEPFAKAILSFLKE